MVSVVKLYVNNLSEGALKKYPVRAVRRHRHVTEPTQLNNRRQLARRPVRLIDLIAGILTIDRR